MTDVSRSKIDVNADAPFYMLHKTVRALEIVPAFRDGYSLVKACVAVAFLAASPLMALNARADETTIRCIFNDKEWLAPRPLCGALLHEAGSLFSQWGIIKGKDMLARCASDIEKETPGQDRQTYLSACETMLKAVRLSEAP
jgi:hypothetical protein